MNYVGDQSDTHAAQRETQRERGVRVCLCLTRTEPKNQVVLFLQKRPTLRGGHKKVPHVKGILCNPLPPPDRWAAEEIGITVRATSIYPIRVLQGWGH